MTRPFLYGGQAVIEGVMIRGRRHLSIAVRRPQGDIHVVCQPLAHLYTGRLRQVPLVRGILVLIETLSLGVRALNYSANVALEKEGVKFSGPAMAITLAVSLIFGVGLFFLLPLFAVKTVDQQLASDLLSNFIEGIIRMGIFLLYLIAIGFIPEVKRVFAYHGAEHKAVHAQERGVPLEVDKVQVYPKAHPRCGTAFLLVVMIVAIVVFSFLGRPSLEWRILSRVLLIPVIAAVSYELIRFSGTHHANPLVRWVMAPSLLLQRLTTREPDASQVEVAISAVSAAVDADAEAEGLALSQEKSLGEKPAEDMSQRP